MALKLWTVQERSETIGSIHIEVIMFKFAVYVRFWQSSAWSKRYVYAADKAYKKGDVVVVPAGSFYAVGEVSDCTDEHNWQSNKKYSKIIGKIDAASYNPDDKFEDKFKINVKTSTGKYLLVDRIEEEEGVIEVTLKDE